MDGGSLARLAAEFRPAGFPDDVNGLSVERDGDVFESEGNEPGAEMPADREAPVAGDMFWEAVDVGAEIGSTLRLRPANGSVVALAWLLPPRENGKYFFAPDGCSCDSDLLAERSRSARLNSLRSEPGVGPVWMNGN